ncbi:uncharacterized protein LOC112509974 isoform X2 [Cynara cardunculus var. scolymus]|uniref:uncharacterized protein LOC112509974 isoform X2 n=1 Tax=Cynara cardunculus var. scolymus TaxID=59895 RepID=UPI000D62AD14|nr:uncharacterized protein LOC112509974 isoform X2 [Cynara cardunculus var. scolymus]
MGNCQAVDNASLVLQTQNGRAQRFYSPISAAQIMKLHPGHYVALLLTTTFYSSSDHHQHPNLINPTTTTTTQQPLRVTRIKLLRPTDNLVLGHAYRLITTQEVMKGLKAKKNGKLIDNNNTSSQPPESLGVSEANSDCKAAASRSHQSGKTHHQMKKPDKHRPRTAVPAKSAAAGSKPRSWHPSLNSISEATN